MRSTLTTLGSLLATCCLAGCFGHDTCLDMPMWEVNQRLDRLHAAASKADFNAYFECFTPDAIFLGTDASERWTLDQFKAYCKPYFDQGKGWTYKPHDRHINLPTWEPPDIVWFDELLDNDKYGTCRGSGVLLRVGPTNTVENWKIAQYNLTFTIPNDKAAEVTAITKQPAQPR